MPVGNDFYHVYFPEYVTDILDRGNQQKTDKEITILSFIRLFRWKTQNDSCTLPNFAVNGDGAIM